MQSSVTEEFVLVADCVIGLMLKSVMLALPRVTELVLILKVVPSKLSPEIVTIQLVPPPPEASRLVVVTF